MSTFEQAMADLDSLKTAFQAPAPQGPPPGMPPQGAPPPGAGGPPGMPPGGPPPGPGGAPMDPNAMPPGGAPPSPGGPPPGDPNAGGAPGAGLPPEVAQAFQQFGDTLQQVVQAVEMLVQGKAKTDALMQQMQQKLMEHDVQHKQTQDAVLQPAPPQQAMLQ